MFEKCQKTTNESAESFAEWIGSETGWEVEWEILSATKFGSFAIKKTSSEPYLEVKFQLYTHRYHYRFFCWAHIPTNIGV